MSGGGNDAGVAATTPLARLRALVAAALPRGSSEHRLLRATSWALVGEATTQLLALVAAAWSARILGQLAFGEVGMVKNTVGLFGVVAGLGFGLGSTKHVAELRRRDAARAGRMIALGRLATLAGAGLAALVLLLAAPALAARSLNAPHLADDLRIAAALLLFTTLTATDSGVLAGLEAFRALALVSLLRGVVALPLTVGGAWLYGVHGAVWGLALAALAGFVLTGIAVRTACRAEGIAVGYRGLGTELGVLWTFSLPTFLSAALVTGAGWAASALLVRRPGGYAEMGLFSAANQWRVAILLVPTVIARGSLPVLADAIGRGDGAGASRLLKASMLLNAAVTLPLVALLGGIGPFLMASYGASFRAGAPALIALLASVVLLAIATPVGSLITASGRMWTGLLMNLGWALVLIGSTYALVERGALGLGLAYVAAYAVHCVWTFGFAARYLRRSR